MQVIGVEKNAVGSGSTAEIEDFVGRTGITFPTGFDLSRSYADLRAAAPVGSSPNSVHIVIDRDGTVAYLSRYFDEAMVAAVEALLP